MYANQLFSTRESKTKVVIFTIENVAVLKQMTEKKCFVCEKEKNAKQNKKKTQTHTHIHSRRSCLKAEIFSCLYLYRGFIFLVTFDLPAIF